MQVVIAPNAFKNSLPAAAAAAAIRDGLLESNLDCDCICFPVGDGGDGTAELIIQHCKGVVITTEVNDPLGRKMNSKYGLIDNGSTAVIEMADASGLRLLKPAEYDPLHASSYGTGELINAALNKEVDKIILCIGGSATADAAAGILRAMGIRFLDADGNEIIDQPERMIELESLDLAGLDERILNCKLIVLCDVENTLLGKQGAANVFGPQKGATPADVNKLEAALTRFRDVVFRQTGSDLSIIKHGGAAGGVAAGLAAIVNAELVNGIESFLSLTDFEDVLTAADLVITGEGSLDIQTLQGKGPYGVAKMAKQKNIPVIGLAGKIQTPVPTGLLQYFNKLISITKEGEDIDLAMKNTAINIRQVAMQLGNRLASGDLIY